MSFRLSQGDCENGQGYISLWMTVLWLDAPLIAPVFLENPIAVWGHWNEEEMEKRLENHTLLSTLPSPQIMLIRANLKLCTDFTWTEM